MNLRLRTKLLITYLLIAVIGYALIYFVGNRIVLRQQTNSVIRQLYRDANYLANSYRFNTGSVNQGELEAMAYAGNMEIWILSLDGNVLTNTGSSDLSGLTVKFLPMDGIEGHYMIGDFYGLFDEQMISVYAPLTMDVAARGYCLLHYSMAAVVQEADRIMVAVFITYGSLLLLLLLLLIFFEIHFTHPVCALTNAAQEYANGNLAYEMPVKRRDELGDLALTIEDLAHQLSSSAEDQHRFLANISHDFRSPLTSIRGYMVAIQDGTIPPEMQGKYIDVVITEADRLTKLANSLIDMTQLEKGVILEKSDFDINDLIRNVLPTFEGRVDEKNLDFNVTFEEQHVYVNADKQRIQQVLYNLIDNAIKFSGTDSSVDISTQLHGDKIFVSVKDHGVGIEKENLNKIWERFYKTDASRGKDKKGTGLGLPIVREIIQAHKENIDVISTSGVGTEFIFTLTRV